MRLLLDECLDHRLRLHFGAHDCVSARYAGLAGFKNGRLLEVAEASGFDVLISADQEMLYQQNLRKRRISILVLCGSTNRLKDLQPLIPAALKSLAIIQPGEVMEVRCENELD
jgi:predicted nuclease of predicted toxin-antitoxin system